MDHPGVTTRPTARTLDEQPVELTPEVAEPMAGMRITIGTALRARDVSRPDAADEEAARQADAAAAKAANATPAATPPRPAPRQPREPHRPRSGGGQAKGPG